MARFRLGCRSRRRQRFGLRIGGERIVGIGGIRGLDLDALLDFLAAAAPDEAARKTIWSTGCNSWYLDAQGVPASWPWTFSQFAETMARPEMTAFEAAA